MPGGLLVEQRELVEVHDGNGKVALGSRAHLLPGVSEECKMQVDTSERSCFRELRQ